MTNRMPLKLIGFMLFFSAGDRLIVGVARPLLNIRLAPVLTGNSSRDTYSTVG